jgi:hypothetical protein
MSRTLVGRGAVAVGTTLVGIGSVSSWALVEMPSRTVAVAGWDRGGLAALVGGLVAAAALWWGRTALAAAAASATAGFVALTLYELPGVLLDELAGGRSAEVGWGGGAALLGVLVLLGGAVCDLAARAAAS